MDSIHKELDMCRVVNKRWEPHQVYIGRGSVLGNPFPINEDIGDTRDAVIKRYRLWLWKQIGDGKISIAYLRSLNGKTLGCYCAPLPCHGDVVVEAVKWAIDQHMCASKETLEQRAKRELGFPMEGGIDG